MEQKKITPEFGKEKSNKLDALKKEFEQEKQRSLPTTRIVNLKLKLSCGCGSGYGDIQREVPYDSELQDGDIVENLGENDTIHESSALPIFVESLFKSLSR